MAWIAVQEDLYGSKLRELYHHLECSEAEAVGFLVALWLWGLKNADKDGYLAFAGKDEIARYLYSRAAGSDLEPEKIVDALVETGWLDNTETGFSIHDWGFWQKEWYKAIERREADAKRQRRNRAKSGDEKKPEQSEKPKPMEPEQKDGDQLSLDPAEEKPKPEKYAKDFEEFWEAYPRKDEKGNAYAKWNARKKDGFSAEELILAARNYAKSCRAKRTDREYIKQAKTFLSANTPFVDYLPKRKDDGPKKEEAHNPNPFASFLEE